MKTALISLLLLFVICSGLLAQQRSDSVRWSTVLRSRVTPSIQMQDDSSVFLLYSEFISYRNRVKNYHFWMGRIGQDLTNPIRVRIKLPRHHQFQFHAVSNNTLYFFSAVSDSVHRETVLYAQAVDKKTLKLQSPLPVVRFAGIYYTLSFGFNRSPDSTKILIHAKTSNKRSDLLTPDRVRLWVVDQHLKLLSTKNDPVTFLRFGEVFDATYFAVGDDGIAFMLGKVYASRKDWLRRSATPGSYVNPIQYALDPMATFFTSFKYNLSICSPDGAEKNIPIDAGVFIDRLKMAVGSDQQLLLSGVYSSDFRSQSIGFIAMKIDKRSDVFQYRTLFPYNDLLNASLPAKGPANSYFSRSDFNMFPMKDSSLIVVGEFKVYPLYGSLRYPHPARVIATVSFSPAGKIKWERGFSRERYWQPGFNGFSTLATDRKIEYSEIDETSNKSFITFLYNKLPNDQFKRTTTLPDGTVQTQILFHNNTLKPMPLFSRLSANSMIVIRRDGRSFQVGKVVARGSEIL